VRAAWEGLDAAKVWDCHVHLLGNGDAGSGIFVNPRMDSLFSPAQYARRLFFLNAACAHDARGSVDQAYVERMHNLLDDMRPGVKLLLFAFERAHDERGVPPRSMFPTRMRATPRNGTRRISSGRHRFIPIVATLWRRCKKQRARARAR